MRFLHANEGSPALDDVTLGVIRSHDRGRTWSTPTIINTLQTIGVTDFKTDEPVRTGGIVPNIAVDPQTGILYVVWQDSRFSGHERDGIAFSTSRDGGLTWSAPVQINKATRVQAFTASIAVTDDVIAVTYYDFRRDNRDPAVLLTDLWRIISNNGGRTWREAHVAGPFDMRTAPFASGFLVGDYEAVGHTQNDFLPFFVIANSGNVSNRTDVFATPIESNDEADGAAVSETSVVDRGWQQRVNSHRESGRGDRH